MILEERKKQLENQIEEMERNINYLGVYIQIVEDLEKTPEIQEYLFFIERLNYYKSLDSRYVDSDLAALKKALAKVDEELKLTRKL